MTGGAAMAGATFDYTALRPEIAREARAAADRIRTRLRDNCIATGRDLLAIKDRLEHGQFSKWLADLDLTSRSAENYMNAARLADKHENVSLLPAAAIYALAAPSAPPAAVQAVLSDAAAGQRQTVRDIKARIAAAIDAERKAKAEEKKTPEQRRKEAETERRQQQRQAAEGEARKNAREGDARDQSRAVAEWLLHRLGPWAMGELLVLARGVDWRDVQRHFETGPDALMSAPQIMEAFCVAADGSPVEVAP